jgi:hypothetical protein
VVRETVTAVRSTESEPFSGEILVTSRIVDFLSSGLYRTPAACLKELINNSFDADARTVNVFIKPDADRIVIEDDGEGMSKEDFVRHFSRVSESHKREETDHTKSGRPKIGRIGIGFIAANELCDEMELVSTQEGSTKLLRVVINFAEMRKGTQGRRRGGGALPADFAKAHYEGTTEETDKASHYTWLFLSRIRGDANRMLLASTQRQDRGRDPLSLYGLSPERVLKVLTKPGLDSWAQLDAYSATVVNLGLNVPVEYLPHWYPTRWKKFLAVFDEEVQKLQFQVVVDGAPLRKPVAFRRAERSLCEYFEYVGENVSARGYFYAQRMTLRPVDLQGVLLRVRNAAVGEYDRSFWDFPPDEGRLFQSWISSEVWSDSIEDAVNIDRRTLRVGHPA